MFNELLSKVVGFFSRSFWLGHFLPVVIFGVLHLIAAKLVFGDALDLSSWTKLSSKEDLVFGSLVALSPVVVAYAMAPSLPYLRGLLDGTLLPAGLHDRLRRQRLSRFYAERQTWNALASEADQLVRGRRAWIRALQDAAKRGEGQALGDQKTLALAKAENDRLEAHLREGRLPPTRDARTAVILVEALLRSHDIEAKDDMGKAIHVERDRLHELLRIAEGEAHYQMRLARLRQPALGLVEGPPATQIGDARTLAAQHSLKAYGVEFEFIWPRLQMILKDDDPAQARLAAAQTQVDFAVMLLVLSVTLLGWIPVAAMWAHSPWAVVAVGFGAPPLIVLGVRMVIAAHTAFGEVVKAVIDTQRMSLLKALNQKLPDSLEAERTLWKQLQAAERGVAVPIIYKKTEEVPA